MTTAQAEQRLRAAGLETRVTLGQVPTAGGHSIVWQAVVSLAGPGYSGSPYAVGTNSSRYTAVTKAVRKALWEARREGRIPSEVA